MTVADLSLCLFALMAGLPREERLKPNPTGALKALGIDGMMQINAGKYTTGGSGVMTIELSGFQFFFLYLGLFMAGAAFGWQFPQGNLLFDGEKYVLIALNLCWPFVVILNARN
jgi:hypothetical protein